MGTYKFRLTTILLAVILVLSLTGCMTSYRDLLGNPEVDFDDTGATGTDEPSNTTEEETAEQPEMFSFYIQTDPLYEVEAYRTLLPEGWSGSGSVEWDFASTAAPAYASFFATSPDGLAGFARKTDEHYVYQVYSGAYNSDSIASSDGFPLRLPCTSVEMAYEIPMALLPDLENMHVSGSENVDPDGVLDMQYKELLTPGLEAAASYGSSYGNIYCTMDKIYGEATLAGEAIEFFALITMAGYTLETPGNQLTITSDYWTVANTMFFYAPQGRMAEYYKDLDVLASNYVDNQNWLALRSNVTDELYALLRQQQLQDWAQANAFSQALYQRFYDTYPYAGTYSSGSAGSIFDDMSDSSSSIHESWEQTLTGYETYDLGSQGTMTVDGFYDNMWSDGSGNFVGSNDPAYSPGYGWNQVYTVTE